MQQRGLMYPMSVFYRRWADLLERLNAEASPILLTHRGKSVAVLVDLDTFAQMERAQRLREAYFNRSFEE